ncbi:MAG TPA: hypothetical protein VMF06_16170 [Candidatus Limnocylindria bacterium]|jgi:hypothetical protein|nr:hypothetical protein [Candidatus Limnocylindria bacterium]
MDDPLGKSDYEVYQAVILGLYGGEGRKQFIISEHLYSRSFYKNDGEERRKSVSDNSWVSGG